MSSLSDDAEVAIDVRELESRGFDGVDGVISIITLAVGGAFGGFSAAVGEEAWGGVKNIVKRLARPKGDGAVDSRKRIVVVVRRPVGLDGIQYSCEVETVEDLVRFRSAIAEIESADGPRVPNGTVLHYHILDGEWYES